MSYTKEMYELECKLFEEKYPGKKYPKVDLPKWLKG